MEALDIQITAKTSEEFAKVEAKLRTLPEEVLSQIDTAHKHFHFGIQAHFKRNHRHTTQNIAIPSDTIKILDNGKNVDILTKDFQFVIDGDLYKDNYNYCIIQSK